MSCSKLLIIGRSLWNSNLDAAATLEPDQLRPLAVMEEPQKLLLQELKFQQHITVISKY